MIRTITIALTAAALLASPAAAGTTRLNIAGKTPQEVAQAVWAASQVTCRKEGVMITMIQAHRACVAATYRSTMSRSDNPQLAALANALPES
jgi:hypothetical protein